MYNTRYIICVSEKKPTDDEGPTYYIILYAVVCGFHRDLSRFKLYYILLCVLYDNIWELSIQIVFAPSVFPIDTSSENCQ